MKQKLFTLLACLLIGAGGCHRSASSSNRNPPAPANTSYLNASAGSSSGDMMVVPVTSTAVELSKPDVSTKSNSVIISGFVRLRGAQFNPDAVVLIMVVDRHGAEAQQIRAVLHETDTTNVLSYRANFGPVPAKGSTISIVYDDYHPTANYSGAYVGSPGSNIRTSTGQGTKSSGGKSRNGRGAHAVAGPKFSR